MTELIGAEGLTSAPWITALGWALIHFLWQGAVVGSLFAGGCWLLRNARPQARYILGLLCMGTLLVAPFATWWTLLEQNTLAAPVIAWPDSTVATQAAVMTSGWDMALMFEQALPWVVLLWALGVLVMSGRVGLNWYRMTRCTRVGVKPLPAEVMEKVAFLKALFGIRRGVEVLETTLLQVPTVLGWLRPVILLPTSSLVGLTPAQLELVIAHELGHIRRLDYLVNLFQVLVETLFYYHPVVGWISRRVRHEREQCCDDLVVARCGNRIEYAKALTNLESIRSGYIAPALAATEGKLVQRIERIVCAHGRRNEAVFGNSGLLLLIAGVVLIGGKLADPMAAFEDHRARLGDALVAELLADQRQREEFVALDQVSVSVFDEPVVAKSTAPVVERVQQASSTPTAMASSNIARQGTEAETTQAAAIRPPAIDRSHAIASPAFDPRIATQPSSSASAAEKPAEQTLAMVQRPQSEPATALPRASSPTQPSGPVAIQRVSPEYPVRARVAGQQGYVLVEFTVRPDGRVSDVKVADSRPRRVFDRAATRAIKGWRFDPSTVSGAERVSQRFDFNLQSGPPLEPVDRNCLPLTGSRICRPDSPTSLMAAEANLP